MALSRSFSKNKQHQKQQDRTAFLQQLADFTPDLLFVMDLDEGDIIYINNRAEAVIGYDAEYVYEHSQEIQKKVIHPDDYQRRLDNLERCRQLTDNEELQLEVRMKLAGGDWNWFKIRDKVFKRAPNGVVIQTIGIAQNVEEQKIADEKLKEEHRRFKDAQSIGKIGSFERLLPSEQLTCSEELCNIFGIEPNAEEISLQDFLAFTHPDDLDTFLSRVNYMHATGEPIDEVNRIIRRDGNIRWVHRRIEIIKTVEGKNLRVYGTIQDITEQVEAQEKIRQSESLMRQAEMVGNFGSYKLDLKTGELKVSDGFYRLFGYEPNVFEINREFIDKASHPEDTKRVAQILEKAQQEKEAYEYIRRIYLPNGQMRYLSSKGKVICDDAGNPIKLIGIVENITERKLAEKQLEENALFIRKVAETTPDILFVFEFEQRRLQYINRDLSLLLGRSWKTIQETDPDFFIPLIHPDDLENALTYMKSFEDASDEDLKEVELRIRDIRGNWRWFHCRGRVFKRNEEEKVVQYLSIMREVTAEKNTTKALLEAEKLSVKGSMARTIAHEVRGPAANIALSMKMLHKELAVALNQNEEAKIYLEIVSKSCDRITDFINDLINIPVTEPDAFVEHDLGKLLEEVLNQAQDRIFLKGIKVERHFNYENYVLADRDRLKIALLNIVMNAIEAMEEQEGILQLFIGEHEAKINLTVQDNGCGMTEEQKTKMFDAYYTSKPDGMGIGLANVKAILDEHSADIEVKSKKGQGTEFTVSFSKPE